MTRQKEKKNLSGKCWGEGYKYLQHHANLFNGNISVAHCMPLSTRPKGSRMMSPPGFQIYLWPPVTLILNLLTIEVHRSCPCSGGRFTPICIEISLCVFKIQHSQVGNRRTKEWTHRRTKGHVMNFMPSASLDQSTDKKSVC